MEMTGEQIAAIMYDELSDKKYDDIADDLLNDNDFYFELCGEVNRHDTETEVITKLKELIKVRGK